MKQFILVSSAVVVVITTLLFAVINMDTVSAKDPSSPSVERIGEITGGYVYRLRDKQTGTYCYISEVFGATGAGTSISCVDRP